MTMSLRKKAYAAIGVSVLNFLGFLGITFQYDQRLVFVGTAVVAAAAMYMMSLRCPHCNSPVLRKRIRVLGESFLYWSPFVPDRCPNCDHDLHC